LILRDVTALLHRRSLRLWIGPDLRRRVHKVLLPRFNGMSIADWTDHLRSPETGIGSQAENLSIKQL
jgi:hypothetical protein